MWIDDIVFHQASSKLTVVGWVPRKTVVVVGRSNSIKRECNSSAFLDDKVPVFKRSGGGGTVVLHPGVVVISVGAWVNSYYRNDLYFREINSSLIETLASEWQVFSELKQRGVSDIALGGRKIVGTSMYRSRNYLLFQSSILVENRIEEIERYLRHPSKEPNYRNGKSHRVFCSSISQELEQNVESNSVCRLFSDLFVGNVIDKINRNLIVPPNDQLKYIRNKASNEFFLEEKCINYWSHTF